MGRVIEKSPPVHLFGHTAYYLIVEDELTEGRDVLGPLDQDEELLLHALPDVRDVGQPLGGDVVVRQLVTHLVAVVTLDITIRIQSIYDFSATLLVPLNKTLHHFVNSPHITITCIAMSLLTANP